MGDLWPAEYIVRKATRRKPGTGFYRHFLNRVETCTSKEADWDAGVKVFNGLSVCKAHKRHGGRKARHLFESLLDFPRSPKNNRKWTG